MNQASCDITSTRSSTPSILPAITEVMPIGVILKKQAMFSITTCRKAVMPSLSIFDFDFKTHHITVETIRMMTSNTALKKSMTTWPFSPSVPRNVPKTRQKKTMPRVFVPLLYCITLINSSSPKTSVVDSWSELFWTGCFFGTYTVCACITALLLLNYKTNFSLFDKIYCKNREIILTCWKAAWNKLSGNMFLRNN